MGMSKGIDARIRWEGYRPARRAVNRLFGQRTPEEDRFSELEAKIDQLREEIKNNRGDFTYAEAQKRLKELENELKGERSGEND